jgi:hypothetical protein
MTKRIKLPPLVEGQPIIVSWFDAWQDSDEHGTPADIMKLPERIMCHDVGFYIGAGRHYLVIATEKMGDEQYRHTHRIPKVNITKVETLHEQAKVD